MAHDIMNQFYAAHNLPLQEKLEELTRIIDLSIPNKDLQILYPNLISNIFSSFHNGWGLRIITYDANKFEFELLTNFLGPQGPLFRLCYKLLSDPQLKYNLPLNALPFDLQMNIEKGRCPQFYADMLCMDSNSLNVVALALNPFDYYIFNYALHLVDHDQCKNSLDNWNSVYFALACDYLVHFLPCDPNAQVLPHISNYTGKVPMAALLQTVNRPLHSPSLLLLPGVTSISNQPSCSQAQSRNEVWRSETVLQVFIDIWMSVEQFGQRNTDFYTQSPLGPRIQPYDAVCSSLERVRVVRVFVKHIHTFSANHLSDPASRSSALRKYARQMMCTRAYHYVKLLVTTWPLDASFRLVMELWLSLIQPWRYTDSAIHQDRISESNEEVSAGVFDQSFVQFVAENYPSYTCIFQLVLSRFTRLDLTTLKNAIMLFRLGKVFSQPRLVPVLKELEQAITNNSGMFVNTESSYNNSTFDENYSNNNLGIQKWAAVAKQATSELNLSPNFQYEPIWAENKKEFSLQFVEKIMSYKIAADNIAKEMAEKLNQGQNGIWGTIKRWLMISISYEDETLMTECEKVPNYLLTSVRYFANIFELDASTLTSMAPIEEDVSQNSSYANASQFSMAITNKLRNNPTEIQYMGDPELKPITSYESTILVRIFYQIASKINGMFGERLQALWERRDLRGRMVREVLTAPCTVRRRAKLGVSNGTRLQVEQLPPRVSLRPLASHAFVARFVVGYVLFRFYSTSVVLYTFTLFVLYSLFVTVKALLKHIGIVKTPPY